MSTLLVLVEHRENRRLISEWLRIRYRVLSASSLDLTERDLMTKPCDLCIVDGPAFDRYWKTLQARRESEAPVLLPILMIASRQDVTLNTRQLWQMIDKLAIAPIEKRELQAQVEVLLRSRLLSLQLKIHQPNSKGLNSDRESIQSTLSQLNIDLQKAFDPPQFKVYYQPIVQLNQGNLVGFEALVRWQHPTRGLVFPDTFIPLAEAIGLIVPLDLWVLQEACRQMRVWQDSLSAAEHLKISVNFSSQHFSQIGFGEKIQKVLQEVKLEADSLKLEITESSLLEDIIATSFTMDQIKATGVELMLDDFGTGYSSFSYLHTLPVDALKIDRSFVWKLEKETNSTEIIQSILNLARNLEMYVIAEGIETAEQLAKLQSWGCEYGQGYFFSRPVDSATAWELIATKKKWT